MGGFDLKPLATGSPLGKLPWPINLDILRYEWHIKRSQCVHHKKSSCLCYKYWQAGHQLMFGTKHIVDSDVWLGGYESLRLVPIFKADGTKTSWGWGYL